MNFDQLSIRTLVVRVERLPRRPDRLLAQAHPRLLRRPVGLPLVAGHARQHAVLPARHTTLRTRHDVVQRQFLAARLGTAVLAGVVVPLENVPAAEGHMGHRQPVVAGQGDHFRHPQPEPHRLDEGPRRRAAAASTSQPRCRAGSRPGPPRGRTRSTAAPAPGPRWRRSPAASCGSGPASAAGVPWESWCTSFPSTGCLARVEPAPSGSQPACSNRYTTDTIYNCLAQHPDQESNLEHLVRSEA